LHQASTAASVSFCVFESGVYSATCLSQLPFPHDHCLLLSQQLGLSSCQLPQAGLWAAHLWAPARLLLQLQLQLLLMCSKLLLDDSQASSFIRQSLITHQQQQQA
jgi:hypothetical protein